MLRDTVAHHSCRTGQKQQIEVIKRILIAVNLCCHKGGRPVEHPPSGAETRAENYTFQTTSKHIRPYSVIAAQTYFSKQHCGKQPRELHQHF